MFTHRVSTKWLNFPSSCFKWLSRNPKRQKWRPKRRREKHKVAHFSSTVASDGESVSVSIEIRKEIKLDLVSIMFIASTVSPERCLMRVAVKDKQEEKKSGEKRIISLNVVELLRWLLCNLHFRRPRLIQLDSNLFQPFCPHRARWCLTRSGTVSHPTSSNTLCKFFGFCLFQRACGVERSRQRRQRQRNKNESLDWAGWLDCHRWAD